MKKLSKTLLAVAAVSAVSMAMAASAMADDFTATYADGTVTLDGVAASGQSQTILVLKGEGTTVDSSNADDVVKQIDQRDDNDVFKSVVVGQLDDDTYEVRIGGTDGTIQTAIFTVGESGDETKEIIIGDIDGAFGVDSDDLTALARALVSLQGEEYGNADVGKTVVVNIDPTTVE